MSGPDQALALRERGSTLLDLRRPAEALAVLAKAMQQNPDDFMTFGLMALALRRLDRPRESHEVIEDGLRRFPNEEWLHRLRSQALFARGSADQALEAAREAHRLGPDVWQAKNQLADVLFGMDRLDEALVVAREEVALAPAEPSAVNQLGRIALRRNQLLEAEQHFRHALRLDPTCAIHHENLGITLFHQGRIEAAALSFDAAAAIDPTYQPAQANLYESSRALRKQSLLSGSGQLLARVSPRAYQYFLHREGETFGMFFWMFVLKGFVPLTLILLLGNAVLEQWGRGVGGGALALSSLGIACVGFVLIALVLPRGPWRTFFEPGPREVAFVSTALAFIFNPLIPLVAGVAGLLAKTDEWELWLVAFIAGLILTLRNLWPRMRGWRYAIGARFYSRWLQQRARAIAYLQESPVGRILARIGRIARQPALWLVASCIGGMLVENEVTRPLWGLAILTSAAFTLIWLVRLGWGLVCRLCFDEASSAPDQR